MRRSATPRSPRRRRIRRIAIWAAAVAAGAGVSLGIAAAWLYADADSTNVGDLDFDNRLAIPPLLEPRIDDDGRRVFDLDLRQGRTRFFADHDTPTWGANGSYLGPTLRASRDDEVVINVHNGLPEPTTVHWHGMHLPAASDGNPHQLIDPGDTWSPSWTIAQPAATLWYHPHPHGSTAEHLYRGVAGLFLLDDPDSEMLGLPTDYGIDDIPLIVQDKRFNGDGTLNFDAPTFSPVGILGSDIIVNGTYDPHVEVVTERVRLRLLNASNARVYNFGFDDDREFQLIATDGGLLETAHVTRRVQLSPGERAEIVVDVDPGDAPVLRSYHPNLGAGRWQGRFAGGHDTFDILQLRAGNDLRASREVTEQLSDHGTLESERPHTTRRFRLDGSSRINGQRMDPDRIDATVTVDTSEVWEIENSSGNPHNFHIHDVQFQIIDIDGEPPPPPLAGWKDTVYIPPRQTVRLIAHFADYTDADVPYMFHCHILRHEDRGMMGQFLVDAERSTSPTEQSNHDH